MSNKETERQNVNVMGQTVPIITVMPTPELSYAHMTQRQYAAIKLRVPDSGTDWLDVMIIASHRNELAARAMQAAVTAWQSTEADRAVSFASIIAEDSYEIADAMLEARKS